MDQVVWYVGLTLTGFGVGTIFAYVATRAASMAYFRSRFEYDRQTDRVVRN